MNKPRTTFIAACILICIFAGCRTADKEPKAKMLESSVKTEILEHKGSALGINKLPVWVETYIETGITGLEKLPDYENHYCFVGTASGSGLAEIQAWGENFDVPKEIAKSIAARTEARFSGSAAGSPDTEYAVYFEELVRTVADAQFSGVRKINDWWVLVRTFSPDGKNKYKDEYHAYVLYTVSRDILDWQILAAIEKAESADKLSASQQAAAEKVRSIIKSEGI